MHSNPSRSGVVISCKIEIVLYTFLYVQGTGINVDLANFILLQTHISEKDRASITSEFPFR